MEGGTGMLHEQQIDTIYDKAQDTPHEECGVFGLWAPGQDVATLTYYALVALQHRGQESAGIVVADGEELAFHKGMGLVSDVFSSASLAGLSGNGAIGHVRYSTTGSSALDNCQPVVVRYKAGHLALAHNGNLVNAHTVRAELEKEGSIFQSTIDSEVLAHLIARSHHQQLEAAVIESAQRVQGGYALVFLTPTKLIALRDPNGIRPLSLGRLDDRWVVSSETCAFDTIGARFVRDVHPGEMVVIDDHGLRTYQALPAGRPSLCAFEYIYFARPDSDIQGLNVHTIRKRLGRRLAMEAPVEADLVTGVPDSSISAAIGYAEQAGIPYEMGLIKNRYIGRTFIQPNQAIRQTGVKLKLNPVRRVVEGKRVVLVDDSIVRGTTTKHIVNLLREAGAREVHVRISSPPYTHSCYFGIDTSSRAELIAANKSVEEIRSLTGADSLHYLSIDSLSDTLAEQQVSLCLACFNGDYPVKIKQAANKFSLEAIRREPR